MGRLLFTILNIIFFAPGFILIVWLYGKKIGKANKLAIAGLIFSIIGYFITDYFSTTWGAWAYYLTHTSGLILMGRSVFEVLIWSMLVGIGFALFVNYFAEKEENKKPFFKK